MKTVIFTMGFMATGLVLALAGCGSAVPACQSECTQGQTRCIQEKNGFEVCGDFNHDSCLQWGDFEQCPEGEACLAGSCQSNDKGLELTGSLVPASGTSSGKGLKLTGEISRDFAPSESHAGAMKLEHMGFTTR